MTMFLAPYTAIADIDGSPLDAGFLFFGEYGKDPELFPVEIFWDADFTVPAAQPIRTRNGYPVRNGSPAKVYLKTAQHSIAIKNRKGAFVLVDFYNKELVSTLDARQIKTAGGGNQQEVNDDISRRFLDLSDTTIYMKRYSHLIADGYWDEAIKQGVRDAVQSTFGGIFKLKFPAGIIKVRESSIFTLGLTAGTKRGLVIEGEGKIEHMEQYAECSAKVDAYIKIHKPSK